MREIDVTGYLKPAIVGAGAAPLLQWLAIRDLVIDSNYHSPISGKGRRRVERIARSFSWSHFATVIVAPVGDKKDNTYVIVDGRYRVTAAAVAGFDQVPCQIVQADREERAIAFKAVNRTFNTSTRMAVQAAEYTASEPHAIQLAQLCARADVELLRYPVPVDRQRAGQTMAVGALAQCLKRFGEETLITALQCVTQTTNNRPGLLSARIIKALCSVLGNDRVLRDSGLGLLETFDTIDLLELSNKATADAAIKGVSPVQLLVDRVRSEVGRKLRKPMIADRVERILDAAPEARLALMRKSKLTAPLKSQRQVQKF
jgi:hypothetical protein